MKYYLELKTCKYETRKIICLLNLDFSGQSYLKPQKNGFNLDVNQAASFTGLSKQRLYALVSKKKVPMLELEDEFFL